MNQTTAVVAIIQHDQKTLIIHRAESDLYELPHAYLSPGDQPEACLRTLLGGLNIANAPSQLRSSIVFQDEQGRNQLLLIYLVGVGSFVVKLDDTHDKYQWENAHKIQHLRLTNMASAALELPSVFQKTDVGTRPSSENVVKKSANRSVVVYSDGGSRGNPGPSAAGFVIWDKDHNLLFEGGKYLGVTTNNQAEYQAVRLGLEKALELGARQVLFNMDSQLVVNQMLGAYQIKNRDLWPIYGSIKDLVSQFEKVTFTHIRREFNQEADAMVNKILDQHTFHS